MCEQTTSTPHRVHTPLSVLYALGSLSLLFRIFFHAVEQKKKIFFLILSLAFRFLGRLSSFGSSCLFHIIIFLCFPCVSIFICSLRFEKIDCDKKFHFFFFFFQIQRDKCNKYGEQPTTTIGSNHNICVTLFAVHFLLSFIRFHSLSVLANLWKTQFVSIIDENSCSPFTINTRLSIIRIHILRNYVHNVRIVSKKKKKNRLNRDSNVDIH